VSGYPMRKRLPYLDGSEHTIVRVERSDSKLPAFMRVAKGASAWLCAAESTIHATCYKLHENGLATMQTPSSDISILVVTLNQQLRAWRYAADDSPSCSRLSTFARSLNV
jgi:hypothetical protein